MFGPGTWILSGFTRLSQFMLISRVVFSNGSFPNHNLVPVLARVWKSKAPSKVATFALQLL